MNVVYSAEQMNVTTLHCLENLVIPATLISCKNTENTLCLRRSKFRKRGKRTVYEVDKVFWKQC